MTRWLNYRRISWGIFFLMLALAIWHVHGGKTDWQSAELWKSLFGFSEKEPMQIIFREVRIPRTFMALIAGAGLSIAGLLMQTLFNNPLAGPSVLGITSGSSLFVAITMMTGIPFFTSDLGIVSTALIGAILFSLIILFFSFFVKSQVSLLLIGMMLGSFTSAVIQVLQATSNANQLKAFTLWGFGSLQQVDFDQIPLIFIVFAAGSFALIWLIKPLNLLVIGEKPTQVLGIPLKAFRLWIIVVTSIFAGLITAYCGPVSFIGLAVPNMVKLLYKTQNHLRLFVGCALVGACTLLLCDLIIQWTEEFILLPLNGVTALIGAPFVIWIILKKF